MASASGGVFTWPIDCVPRQKILRSQQLGKVDSSGNTLIPHLHFGVYNEESGMYRPVDPWKGACNSSSDGLWVSAVSYRTVELLLAHPGENFEEKQNNREHVTNLYN